MDNTQTIISIATGSRGLEIGLEQAGVKLRVAAYVEVEAFIIENLVAAMETGNLDPAPVWTDIKTFPAKLFRGKIHGITAGYPCQPFSVAGDRKGVDDPRHIFPYILRTIETIKPLWVWFENVEGHLTMGYGEVYRGLRDLGYRVEAGIFSAEEVGAPHKRRRLFILGIMEYPEMSKRKRTGDTRRRRDGLANTGLVYSTIKGLQESCRAASEKQFKPTSDVLANANENDRGTNNREFQSQTKKTERTSQRKHGERLRNELSGSSKLADPGSNGNTARLSRQKQREKGQSKKPYDNCNRWPARPGQQQYKWEEPRTLPKKIRRKGNPTIKPSVGRSVDGYNFRTDLLYMYGNAVVRQTAAKAFITLLNKF